MNILKTGILSTLLAITCNFAIAQCSTLTVPNNILSNGDFEITTETNPPFVDWFQFGAAYQTPFPPQFTTFQNSLGSAMTEGYFFVGFSGIFQDLPAIPGDEYTAGMWISHSSCNALAGPDRAYASIEFYDDQFTLIERYTGAFVDETSPTDEFILSQVTATVPVGATIVRVVGVHDHNGSTGAVNYDDAFLVVGDGTNEILEILETEPPVISCEMLVPENLVSTNATFDTGLEGWNLYTEFNTGLNIQYDDINQYASLFGGFVFPLSSIAAISYANPSPANAGESFQACMDLSSLSQDFISSENFAFVELQYLDADGNIIGTEESAHFDNSYTADVPTTMCVKGTVPTGAVSVTIAGVFDQTGCGQGSVKFDNAVLFALTPYDGVAVCGLTITEADLPIPCVTDNCGVASVTNDFPAMLPEGETTVTYTATDINGNISTCSIQIFILPGSMSCNDHITISVDQSCEAFITPDMVLEGVLPIGCQENFTVELTTMGGIPVPQPITYDYTNESNNNYQYTVTNEIGNACWGTITLEDKLKPILECDCPPGAWMTNPECQLNCDDVDRYMNGTNGIPGIADNCGNAEEIFGGAQIQEQECGVYLLTQTWGVKETGYPDDVFYTDLFCVNEYYVTTPSLNDELECPADVIYDCTESGNPSLFLPEETGYPGFGRQDLDGTVGGFCNITAGYDDLEIIPCGEECAGSIKILRTWNIIDWCTLETATCSQVIKIVDQTPPTLIMDDVFTSTSPWVCSTDIWFDDPQLHDDCDNNPEWYIAWTNSGATLVDDEGRTGPNSGPKKHALGVPKGVWVFAIGAVDCCGNAGTIEIIVTVLDKTPPVPVATENIVVSLTSSGDDWDGTGKIFVESIDNGSNDNCSDVWMELRRDTDPCEIDGNMTYSNKIPEYCDPWYDNDDHDYGQFVKFCCDDLTETDSVTGASYGIVKVFMRVWDDGNMDGVYGSYTFHVNPGDNHDYCEFNDNYNEIWVNVRVEDKAPIAILCPPDITIPCHGDYTDLSITGEAISSGTCSHPSVMYEDWPNIHCGEGYVLREWSVPGEEYVCVQRITLEFVESELNVVCATNEDFDGEIWFDPFNPNHVSVDCMDFDFPEPWQSGGKCSLVGVNETVDTFWFEQDACFKAIKTWNYVDWCTGEEAECEFVVSLVDTEPPVVICQDTCFAVNDYWDSDNDGVVCEMTSDVDVYSIAMDSGDCGSAWIKWVAEVDLWYDGTVDLTYSSFLPHNSRYYIAPSMTGTPGVVRLYKDDISAEWAKHVIEWKAFDGCGNVDRCHQYVEVVDKKAPTPYCVGISTALMSPETGNLAEIWAKDFNLGSYDNCTQEQRLGYTFFNVSPVPELLDEEHCFRPVWVNEDQCEPLYDPISGHVVSEEVNNCNGYEDGALDPECPIDGIQKWNPDGVDSDGNTCKTAGLKFKGNAWCGDHNIMVTVWDENANFDFCYVNLIIHGVECAGQANAGRIAGIVSTQSGKTIDQVDVTNSSILINGGEVSYITSGDGFYTFESNIFGGDYAVTAEKDIDYLNGVSTLDLVLIQKHILGQDILESGYDMIAADINNDEAVSAVDLVELRKLILGIYSELPNNMSWRFADANQVLNLQNPWPIVEAVNISNLSIDMMGEDFVGIKIGDVNGNAIANLDDELSEARNNESIGVYAKGSADGSVQIVAAETISSLYGVQFALTIKGSLESVIPGVLDVTNNNFGVLPNKVLTTSIANVSSVDVSEGDVLFTLVGISSASWANTWMNAEAYLDNDSSISIVDINFRTIDTAVGYNLLQNEPNPFSETTNIEFVIGQSSIATISVFDINGKVLKSFTNAYEAGIHTIEITKQDLGTNGIYYYQLESGDFTATRKMILVE